MSRLPRLLPLLAVAGAGVLAINAVENGPGIIGAARSFAEGAAVKPGAAKAANPLPDGASAAPAQPAGQAVGVKPPAICAESAAELAKDAGLSPAELQVLQSLGARRGELDQREQGLETQLALLQAAEAKVDARIATMNALKGDMQGMLGQLDARQQAEVDRLVKVFEAMKPADAAARFVLLVDDVRLPIAAKMKERALSAMLAKMPPAEAKRLTESLAARFVAQANAARAAINPPPAAPAAPPASTTTATAPAKPAQVAAAAPDAGAAATAASPAAAPKPAHRRTVHHPAAAAQAPAKPTASGAAAAANASAAPPAKPATGASAAASAPKPAAAAQATPKPAAPATPPPAAPATTAPAKSG